MKAHLPLAIGLVVLGLILVRALIPDSLELAYMEYRAGLTEAAEQRYQALVTDQDLQAGVVGPLTRIYVAQGNPDKAVALMRRFVSHHPNDLEGLDHLATLLSWVRDWDALARTLRKAARLDPSTARLTRLMNLYSFLGRTADQYRVLAELIERGDHRPAGDLTTLAQWQASQGDTDAALATLETLARTHPDAMDLWVLDLYGAIALAGHQPGRIRPFVLRWAHVMTANQAGWLARGLVDRGAPDLAVGLLTALAERPGAPAALNDDLVRLDRELGRDDAALARLEALAADGRLDATGRALLVGLALDQDDRARARKAALGAPRDLPPPVLDRLIQAFMAAGAGGDLAGLRAALGNGWQGDHPVLAGFLALAIDGPAAARVWADRAADRSLPAEADLRLARLEDALGLKARALARLDRLAGDPDLGADAYDRLASLYIDLHRVADGLARLTALRQANADPAIGLAWARLAARAGHAAAVRQWLTDQGGSLDAAALRQLTADALAGPRADLALDLARRLVRRDATAAAQDLLARALIANGRAAEALTHLAPLLPGDTATALLYAQALQATGAADRRARFLIDRLQAPDLTAQDRADLTWALLDQTDLPAAPALARAAAGRLRRGEAGPGRDADLALLARLDPATALPFLATAAHDDPAAWGGAYVQALRATGDRAGLIAWARARLAADPDARERDDLLFTLIDLRAYGAALPWLRTLAAGGEATWVAAYLDALTATGATEAERAFIAELLARPGLAATERRNLAYRLLDLGDPGPAIAAFRDLAANAPPDSPDVAELLYLTGPRPDPAIRAWLAGRARAAQGAARAAWLRHLTDAGDPAAAAALAATDPGPAGGPVAEAWLAALIAADDPEGLAAAVDRLIPNAPSAHVLAGLARQAEAGGAIPAARRAADAALARAPEDPALLARAARLAADAGAPDAVPLYRRLLAQVPGTAADWLRYGNALQAAGASGRDAWHTAVARLEATPRPDLAARMAGAQALGQIDPAAGSAAWDALRAAHPDDRDVQAEAAAFWIDQWAWSAAADALARPGPVADATLAVPPGAEVTLTGAEVILAYDRPVDGAPFDALARAHPDLIAFASAGYDRVLIRLQAGIAARMTSAGLALTTDPERLAADRRLALLRARLDFRVGDSLAARARVRALVAAEPAADALSELAAMDATLGNWHQALDRYTQARDRRPDDAGLARAMADLRREHGPRITAVGDIQRTQDQDTQVILTQTGRLTPGDRWTLAGEIQSRHVQWDDFVTPGGTNVPLNAWYSRGELEVGYTLDSGDTLAAALLYGPAGPGGRLAWHQPGWGYRTDIIGVWAEPFWDLVAGLTRQATRSYVELRHERQIRPDIGVAGVLSYNHYGMMDVDDPADSVRVEAAANWTLPWDRPTVTLGYSLYAEYMTHLAEQPTPFGPVNPLPLRTQEVHAANVGLSAGTGPWRLEASAGYGIDRYGGQGPFGGGAITAELVDGLEIDLHGYYSALSERATDNPVTRLGLGLIWRF